MQPTDNYNHSHANFTDAVVEHLDASDWDTLEFDKKLQRSMGTVRAKMKTRGIILRHVRASSPQNHIVYGPPAEISSLAESADIAFTNAKFDAAKNGNPTPTWWKSGSTEPDGVLAFFAVGSMWTGPENDTHPARPNDCYCAMLCDPNHSYWKAFLELDGRTLELVAGQISNALTFILRVGRSRFRRFSAFPWRIQERYWIDSVKRGSDRLIPVWNTNRDKDKDKKSVQNSVNTVTLSFDLRKSTFCMAEARTREGFAQWLIELTEMLERTCHEHGGVFDKFTGDGALIHFLHRETKKVYGKDQLAGAFECAKKLLENLEQHLQDLRENVLRKDSDLVGGGVGIDTDKAHWSLDNHSNPIVVGKAVVEACRMCDSAPPGRIRMMSGAYYQLPGPIRHQPQWERVPFSSKEDKQTDGVRVWEYTV